MVQQCGRSVEDSGEVDRIEVFQDPEEFKEVVRLGGRYLLHLPHVAMKRAFERVYEMGDRTGEFLANYGLFLLCLFEEEDDLGERLLEEGKKLLGYESND